jgi:apolipoprotein N-acyltransferase
MIWKRKRRDPEGPPPVPFRSKRNLVEVAVATVCGVLLFTSCADFDLWWHAWAAFAPVLWLVDRAPTPRRAGRLAWWCGIVANAGGFYWIIALLERFAHVPWIVAAVLFLLLCAYQALVFYFFGRVVHRLRRTTSLPMVVIAPVVMVGFELCVPMVFPWYLAITQGWNLHVIQVADLAGPLGVTALLLMVNGAIYDVVTRRRAAWRSAAGAAVVLAAALVYGHVRIGQYTDIRATAPKVTVGVVQPNITFDKKLARPADQVRDLQACSIAAEKAGAELLVWTESSFPFALPRDQTADGPLTQANRIRRGFTSPLVMGAITVDRPRQAGAYPYNSAIMVDRDGGFAARFDKIFLLMFGEYIPGLETFPFLRKFMPPSAGHFARGQEVVTFPFTRAEDAPGTPPWRLGPLICYEDIIPSFGRNLGRLRPHLLVNLTNDAWFGASSEPWEHLQLAVYRSVELRTEMVRAVNTGVSAFIDATGRVYGKSYSIDPAYMGLPPPRMTCGVSQGAKTDMIVAEMALIEGGHTVYAAVGDVFGIVMAVLTLWLWQIRPRLRGRGRGRPG